MSEAIANLAKQCIIFLIQSVDGDTVRSYAIADRKDDIDVVSRNPLR
jgi:hypothetical protein